ncbi:integration host factor, actinobacterial type [Tessaracoccus antarcticus]|uniref:30S ribosomal protein S13 n=1 Tax=Tessaracoccus antarcticus TaxID=2479848 RepID=A0A3M0G8I3_9ACTN|nr:integration host factor, actinobacterial type [Tessaracoccus antarcticus]RMB58732.1 30S ribosomal protein S13 [Tessaracoccus antarcticus]
MAIPQLSTEQLQSARAAATEARRARAALKAQVKEAEITLSEALDKATGDETLSRVKVVDLLRSLPRVGVTRSAEIMENLDIAPNRRIRGLGRHQMERLKEMFS